MKALVLKRPGEASIEEVNEPKTELGQNPAACAHGGALWKRFEFLPGQEPDGEVSANSGPRSCSDGG